MSEDMLEEEVRQKVNYLHHTRHLKERSDHSLVMGHTHYLFQIQVLYDILVAVFLTDEEYRRKFGYPKLCRRANALYFCTFSWQRCAVLIILINKGK